MKQILLSFGFSLITIIAMGQQVNAIQDAINNYNYEKAISLIEKEAPTSSLLILKARALKGLAKYEDAINTLNIVVKENPQNIQILFELAECNKLGGKYDDALACYEQILKINPDHVYANLQKINLLYAIERYAEVQKVCQQMLRKDSSDVVLRMMGQSFEQERNLDVALVYYNKAFEKNPSDFVSVSKAAGIYIDLKDYKPAIKITEAFRKIDAGNIYVNRKNAQALCLDREYEIAIERYKELMAKGDSTKLTCYYLGMSYFASEQFYEAHDCLERAYKYDPKDINILYYLGRACSKTSWKKEGIEFLKDAIDLTTPAPQVLARLNEGLAECYFMDRDYKNQIATIKEQYKHAPNNKLLYRIGSIYQDALKDNKNAEKYLTQFLKNKPKDAPKEEDKMEGGTVVVGDQVLYKAAERRLEDMKNAQFWEGNKK